MTQTSLNTLAIICLGIGQVWIDIELWSLVRKVDSLKMGTKMNWNNWTDDMIIRHFGQSKTKDEIEQIVGRKIAW